MRRSPRTPTLPLALCGAVCIALCGGCYEHVVGVRGPASANYDVQEANIGEGESVWSTPSPRPVEGNRYSGTTLDRAKPVPVKPQKQTD